MKILFRKRPTLVGQKKKEYARKELSHENYEVFNLDRNGVTGRASLFTVEEVVEKQMAPPLKNKRS